MFDYQSPVEMLVGEMTTRIENACNATIQQKLGFNIDKEELVKALQYDRHQYEKGYQDGKAENIIDYKALKMALDNINDIVCGCNEIHCCVNDILVLEIQKELSEILDITGCPRTEQEDTD